MPNWPSSDEKSVGGEIAPRHLRAPDEQHGRKQRGGEAQGRKHQRWQMLQPDMNDDEVGAPHCHDGDGEQRMAQRDVVGADGHHAAPLGDTLAVRRCDDGPLRSKPVHAEIPLHRDDRAFDRLQQRQAQGNGEREP